MDQFHVTQLKDLAGPACIQMILLRNGIRDVTQREIAYTNDVFVPNWGSPPDRMLSCLKLYFENCGISENVTIKDLYDMLLRGFHLITYLQDDFPTETNTAKPYDHTGEDGHIVLVVAVAPNESWVEVSDPLDEKRQYTQTGFVVTEPQPNKSYEVRFKYRIQGEDFKKRWWDTLQNGHEIKHLIIWVDPESRKRISANELY